MPKNVKTFLFLIADGTVKLSGGDQGIQKSTSVREQPERGEEIRDDHRRESDGVLADRHNDGGQRSPKRFFGRSKGITFYRHHVKPRVQLNVPKEESFPIPLRYIDVIRRTHTTLDVLQGSRMDDSWNIAGDRTSSEPRTGFTQITMSHEKKTPDGFL